jgi:hypothetical protein
VNSEFPCSYEKLVSCTKRCKATHSSFPSIFFQAQGERAALKKPHVFYISVKPVAALIFYAGFRLPWQSTEICFEFKISLLNKQKSRRNQPPCFHRRKRKGARGKTPPNEAREACGQTNAAWRSAGKFRCMP